MILHQIYKINFRLNNSSHGLNLLIDLKSTCVAAKAPSTPVEYKYFQ